MKRKSISILQEELERKVQQLADWIRESKHFFVFTVSVEGSGTSNIWMQSVA